MRPRASSPAVIAAAITTARTPFGSQLGGSRPAVAGDIAEVRDVESADRASGRGAASGFGAGPPRIAVARATRRLPRPASSSRFVLATPVRPSSTTRRRTVASRSLTFWWICESGETGERRVPADVHGLRVRTAGAARQGTVEQRVDRLVVVGAVHHDPTPTCTFTETGRAAPWPTWRSASAHPCRSWERPTASTRRREPIASQLPQKRGVIPV